MDEQCSESWHFVTFRRINKTQKSSIDDDLLI